LKLTQVKHLDPPTLAFVQIYKLYGYGQYRMHGVVINLFTNVNQIPLVLPHLPYEDATIGVIL
jgi:hypothetical protein